MPNYKSNPQLVMVIEPETKVRFRYKSEKGSHGPLCGKVKHNGKKTYPTVKLENYFGNKSVYVRVSLYTEDKKDNVLEFKGKTNEDSLHYIEEDLQGDNTAVFSNLKIMSKKKEEIEKMFMDSKLKNLKTNISSAVKAQFEKSYSKEVKERAKAVLNSARLYFEAFEKDAPHVPLCSLFSKPISNQRELKITRISHVAGSWKGGDDVILLCDKIQKDNIKIKFFDNDGSWMDYAIFKPADVHHQFAIAFKTPPYKENTEKTVFVSLERNDEESEPRQFTYKSEKIPTKKRKYETDQFAAAVSPETESSMSISSDSSSNEMPSSIQSIPGCLSNDVLNQTEIEPTLDSDDMDQFLYEICGMDADDLPGLENINFEMIETGEILDNYPLPAEHLIETPENMAMNTIVQNQIYFAQGFEGDQVQVDGGGMFPIVKNPAKLKGSLNRNNSELKVWIDRKKLANEYPVSQMAIMTITEAESASAVSISNEKLKIRTKTDAYLHSDLQKKKICSAILSKRDNAGNTLLHVAVEKNGNIAFILKVGQILKSDIVNVQNNKKQTVLHLAVEKKKAGIVRTLLMNGANPNLKNDDGNNCYHLATLYNYCDIMHYLLTLGRSPDINAFNYEGLSPLHIAIMKNSAICFQLLKLDAINVNLQEQKVGRSLLHYAVEFQTSFVKELLNKEEIDVNIQDFEGNTPLHIACANDDIDVVKDLLQAGADPHLKNYKPNLNTLDENDSDDDTPDGQMPGDMTTNTEKDSDDNTPDCQMPGDMTTNIEILKILQNSTKSKTQSQLNSHDFITVTESTIKANSAMEKLYKYLDEDKRWKLVANYFVDERFIDSLECSESPTKALFTYVKNEHKDYIEVFKSVLELTGLTDAVTIIEDL